MQPCGDGEDRGLLTMFPGGYGIATARDSASPISHGMARVRVPHDIRLEYLEVLSMFWKDRLCGFPVIHDVLEVRSEHFSINAEIVQNV